MMCRVVVIALVLAVAVAVRADEIPEPMHLPCDDTHTVEFEVQRATVEIDGLVTYTTRLFAYDGTPLFPAPTLVMQAGQACQVTLRNALAAGQDPACPYHANAFHCPDTVNLHTHGLHVPFSEDDVSVHLNPGEEHVYVYNIPENHLPGTHWYHAHVHGSTALQVQGGMVGMLMVENAETTIPPAVAALYANSVEMLLSHHNFGGTDTAPGPFRQRDYPALSNAFGTQTITPSPTFAGDARNAYVANGVYHGDVSIEPGSAKLLRIVHGGGQRVLELELVDTSSHCTMTLIARDGVYHTGSYLTLDAIVLVPGTRADVAVVCSAAAANSQITVRAHAAASRDGFLGTDNRFEQDRVFTLNVGASVPAAPVAIPTVFVTLPSYLTDLTTATVSSGKKGVEEIRLGGGEINDVAFGGFEVDWDNRYLEEYCLGEVYEVEFRGGAGGPGGAAGAPHPYHQHVNHAQVHETADTTGIITREGEWRDVVAARETTLRFPTDSFVGTMVIHCHVLQHEDEGMMAAYIVGHCCETDADCEGDYVCHESRGFCACASCDGDCPDGFTCVDSAAGLRVHVFLVAAATLLTLLLAV